MTFRNTMIFGSMAALSALPFCAAATGQASTTPAATGFSLQASYDRPGLPVPHWQITVLPTGEAKYTSEHASGGPAEAVPVQFKMSSGGASKLQQLLDDSHGMQPCETKTKGLARMGMKSLEYRGAAQAAPVQCTFNYTENKPLAAAADYLIAVSFTIEQGVTLEHLHRYDRLGLDPVMTQLAAAWKAGQAKELQSIRPTLESLANDDAVLERVRQKAAELLVAANQS